MYRPVLLIPMLALLWALPASAQVSLPGVDLPRAGTVIDPLVGGVLDDVTQLERDIAREARSLARLRERRIDRLIRRNSDVIERDERGEPARRGVLLVMDIAPEGLAAAQAAGFGLLGQERIAELSLTVETLAIPEGLTLAEAQGQLSLLLPDAMITADNLHFQSGRAAPPPPMPARSAAASSRAVPIGVIDGAPAQTNEAISIRGFAKGAPAASDHGSAVVDLLAYAGARSIHVADVYGANPAGGNALAIAQALGWLVQRGVKVINVSLVGPRNMLVERAIAGAQARGVVIVAAVGNDGPAAPPAYPASYSNVVAVTAVDRRNRALIEAGRALHLDYAAPGADIYGVNARGERDRLRGTSFAAPLVSARIAAAQGVGNSWKRALDSEARDLGERGEDALYGRGLVCEDCRPGR